MSVVLNGNNIAVKAEIVDVSKLGSKTITENGTYNAETDNLNGYSSVEVNVQPTLQEKSVTITENGTTEVLADHGYDGLAKVSVEANVQGGGGDLLNVIKGMNSNTANYTFNLTADMFDENSTTINQYHLYNNLNLSNVEIPNKIVTIDKYAFRNCANLLSVNIGNGVTAINDYAFYGCSNLSKIIINNNNELILYKYAFSNLTRQGELVITGQVKFYSESWRDNYFKILRIPNATYFSNRAINQCRYLEIVDFRGRTLTTIPTRYDTSSFTAQTGNNDVPTNCKFIVPDELYDQWIVATNWATIADRIIKASEYTEA